MFSPATIRFPHPLAVWPFVSGWLLLWGLAAAAPIVIHLWSRRRYRETRWAAMEFLLAAMRKNSRRIWIEQLLLLAVRVAILLLLAVALAEPVLRRLTAPVGAAGRGGATHHLLVLDGSYSMDLRENGKRLFDQARDAALRLVEQSSQGDGFTLLLMADPPQTIIAQPTFDTNVVADELRQLRLPHGGANLAATLGEVEQILQASVRRHPRLALQRVHFLTDLGRTTWDDVAAPTQRTRLKKLAELATLNVVELGGPATVNAAITRLAVADSLLTAGRPTTLEVEVQNFGTQDLAGRTVAFFADGQRIGQTTLDVAAGGRAAASLPHRFDAAGEHFLEAALQDDPLPIDNRRWLALPVKENVRVLCIEGRPDEARYIRLALEPSKSDRPRIRVETAAEHALLETDLRQYDCVFLCNVGRIGRDEAGVLYDYVSGGGGLIVFLGDQVQADSYNAELGGELSKKRSLPARLEQTVSETLHRFDPLGYRHPIVAPFRDQTRAGLLTTPVWKYFRLAPFDKDAAQVALAFDGGDPMIVEEKIARGRSILFATAGSTSSVDQAASPPTPWTAMPTWPSFLPLIQETVGLTLRGQLSLRNVQVGESLQGRLPSGVSSEESSSDAGNSQSVVVAGPADDDGAFGDGGFGEGERVRLIDDGDTRRWTFGSTQTSGVYRSEASGEAAYFAVNLDTRESLLERFDADLLPAQFQSPARADATPAAASSVGEDERPLFRPLLAGLFALLLTESWLAWYFGNRAAGRGA